MYATVIHMSCSKAHAAQVDVNKLWLKACGFTRKEVIGKTMRIVQGPSTERSRVEQILDAVRNRRQISTVLTNYTKTGRIFKNKLRIDPVYGSSAEDPYLLARSEIIFTGETDGLTMHTSQPQESANTSVDVPHLLLEAAPPHRIVVVNDLWLATSGHTRDEVIGKTIHMFLGSETCYSDVQKVVGALQKVASCEKFLKSLTVTLTCYSKSFCQYRNKLKIKSMGSSLDGARASYIIVRSQLVSDDEELDGGGDYVSRKQRCAKKESRHLAHHKGSDNKTQKKSNAVGRAHTDQHSTQREWGPDADAAVLTMSPDRGGSRAPRTQTHNVHDQVLTSDVAAHCQLDQGRDKSYGDPAASALYTRRCNVHSYSDPAVMFSGHKPYPVVDVNDVWLQTCGFTRDEVVGATMRIIQGPATERNLLGRLMSMVRRHRSCRVALTNYTKTGEQFRNELQVEPVGVAEGLSGPHFLARSRITFLVHGPVVMPEPVSSPESDDGGIKSPDVQTFGEPVADTDTNLAALEPCVDQSQLGLDRIQHQVSSHSAEVHPHPLSPSPRLLKHSRARDCISSKMRT
eukprot:SAG11_NODE_183_length_13181_cov_4.027672_3_plen_572_part_00